MPAPTTAVAPSAKPAKLVVETHSGISWLHVAHAVPRDWSAGIYDQSVSAFRELLEGAGARMDQIVRTWLYLGGITEDEGGTERYKELNRARTDFYRGTSFLADRWPGERKTAVFPASTGIGTAGRQLSISAIALATDRPDILATPLENPRQTAAYNYGSRYSPKSPKFSRAMALSCGQYATILISGTASITASETRHIGNVAAQTHETLDNIAALIGEDNLAAHGMPGLGTSLDGLGLARVYIKRSEDCAAVRSVCAERLGRTPTVFALGDVCRSDLLVEIEGMAFSQLAEDPAGVGELPEAAGTAGRA